MEYREFRRGLPRGLQTPVSPERLVWGVLAIAAVLFVIFAGLSSVYRVDASDEGVVLRFGRHVRTVDPGLHFKLPWPLERVQCVPVQRIQTLEFGFATLQAGRVTEYAPPAPEDAEVSEMLSGDLNLATVEWIVQYRIKDAYNYLFGLGGGDGGWNMLADAEANLAVPDTIRDVSESVVRTLVGDRSVDAVLTFGRDAIASEAKLKIQEMLDSFQAGVEIVTVRLQSTSPPDPVKDAFQEVNRARQNKERLVNEAEGERNRQIPAARGKKDQAISEAEGYAERAILETKGKIEAFKAKLVEYQRAPDVTKRRLYLEAMQDVLSQVDEKTVIDDSFQGFLPLLNLNPDNTTPRTLQGGGR